MSLGHSCQSKMSLDAAVERAINECIREEIMEEFLRANRAEVIAMSIFEYNKEEEDKKLRKAEYEAGYDTGYGSGFDAGKQTGLEAGISKGKKEIILEFCMRSVLQERITVFVTVQYPHSYEPKCIPNHLR